MRLRVNIFSGSNPEIIEDCINEWIADNLHAYPYDIFQSQSDGELTISVWYWEEYNEPTQAD